MAVNRVWFLNAPSGTISVLQRAQLCIGYPFGVEPPVPPPIPVIPSTLDIGLPYFKSYLAQLGPHPLGPILRATNPDYTSDLSLEYFKHYLGRN